MELTPSTSGCRLITTNVPGGRVVREFHPNGHERAFRKLNGDGRVDVSYGHKGPWRRAETNEVPDDVWYLLIGEGPKL